MRASSEEGNLSFRGSSPPAVPVFRAVLEPTVNALGALQRVLRCEQPTRPESPDGHWTSVTPDWPRRPRVSP